MQMSLYGNQLKNFGIQLQNISSQIQNIAMNAPMMGNEIQNMAFQISNIGCKIFNIGMNFINQLSLMNNMSNQIQNINRINELNLNKNNNGQINIFFKTDFNSMLNLNLIVPAKITIGELIALYLERINRSPNDNELKFLFNGKALNNYKLKIQECGMINGSLILVYKKQNLIAGP